MTATVRTLGFATSLLALTAGLASAQRGSTRGTMGVPRIVTSPPPSHIRPAPPPLSHGVMTGPRFDGPTGPLGGDVPRVVTPQGYGYGYARGYRIGSNFGGGPTVYNGSGYATGGGVSGFGHRFDPGATRRWRAGYIRDGVGFGCGVGCFGCGFDCFRVGRGVFFGSFVVGYPFFVPIVVPYFYSYGTAYQDRYGTAYQDRYAVDQPVAEYAAEPPRAASKLIVIGGGTGGGGDALTIETIGDSVRLSWLGAGRPAREVKLFVADSTQRPLATRSASAATPTATFEVATLSAPVAFAGVTVTFTDGVTTTTLVPYRSGLTPR